MLFIHRTITGRPGRLTASLGRSDTSSLISYLPLLTAFGSDKSDPYTSRRPCHTMLIILRISTLIHRASFLHRAIALCFGQRPHRLGLCAIRCSLFFAPASCADTSRAVGHPPHISAGVISTLVIPRVITALFAPTTAGALIPYPASKGGEPALCCSSRILPLRKNY